MHVLVTLVALLGLRAGVAGAETITEFVTLVRGTGVAAPPTTTAAPPSYATPSVFEDAVLNSTNTYRARYNASAVEWNETLASFAGDVASGCIFKHSGGPYGENLASGYANATASIEGWGEEVKHFDFKDPGFSEETGHFTQLVWKNTTSVGCAVKDCDGNGGDEAPGWFVVCEYWPRGNVIGQFSDQVGASISGAGSAWKLSEAKWLAVVSSSVLGVLLYCV